MSYDQNNFDCFFWKHGVLVSNYFGNNYSNCTYSYIEVADILR